VAIIGAHALLYTSQPEALRATLRDVFGWKHVDAGDGWLIFALPPAELGVHPAEGLPEASGTRHRITLMCDDINATMEELRAKGPRRRRRAERRSLRDQGDASSARWCRGHAVRAPSSHGDWDVGWLIGSLPSSVRRRRSRRRRDPGAKAKRPA
jgi:hypothetical protein